MEYNQISWQTQSEFEYDMVCPKCSQRLSDVKETYFVGCPECYKVFEQEIAKLATDYHGSCAHFGKVPTISQAKEEITKRLIKLSEEEKEAVLSRDYLKAEKIKQEIKALREGN